MKPLAHSPTLVFHDSAADAVLDRERVHLWLSDLDAGDWDLAGAALMSPAEQDRAGRFKGALLQRRFVASRVQLRRTLGNLLKIAPDKLVFETDANGKPRLAFDAAVTHTFGSSLRFNLSHSENVMLLGVAFDRELGVDVEVMKPDLDVLPLAQAQFAEDECARLRRLNGVERVREFYQLWTRHEAIAKAAGKGITSPRLASEGFEVHPFDFQSGTQTVVGAVARVR